MVVVVALAPFIIKFLAFVKCRITKAISIGAHSIHERAPIY